MSQARLKVWVRRRRMASGFTLVELMITIVVLAILAGLAAPSFADLIERNRLAGAANEIVAAMQTARMEAIRRGESAVICPSANGVTCAGNNWSRFIIFADKDRDSVVDADDVLIREVNSPAGNIQVTASTNTSTNNRIRFAADGFVRVGSAGAREGALSLCTLKLPEAENTRDVVVAVSRISVSTRNGTSACTARKD